jgi:uncharacterized protein (DUF427 family)
MTDLVEWGIAPRVEPSPRRIGVRTGGGTVVAESTRALLLAWYGPGMLPTYCLPAGDVRTDLLRPSSPPGPGRGWGHDVPFTVAHDVVAGDEVVERAALLLRAPAAPLGDIDGLWTFTWDAGLSWFEEALEVHVHARDPSKRVDVLPSDRHVRIELDGHVLAESRRAHALFETTLPTRWYFPPEDVSWDLLSESDTATSCPYKGTARYWSARVGEREHRDLAWSYPDPVVECPRIAGLVCFFNERVDVVVDGDVEATPRTPWS